ncbi:MAG: hypothetical protein GF320_18830 [Armatimonadia bacterium]|nr:hypothetical protein [Armatimonadia bacterium]
MGQGFTTRQGMPLSARVMAALEGGASEGMTEEDVAGVLQELRSVCRGTLLVLRDLGYVEPVHTDAGWRLTEAGRAWSQSSGGSESPVMSAPAPRPCELCGEAVPALWADEYRLCALCTGNPETEALGYDSAGRLRG